MPRSPARTIPPMRAVTSSAMSGNNAREWYLPSGKCQVISTITEGTIPFSHLPVSPTPTRFSPNTKLHALAACRRGQICH